MNPLRKLSWTWSLWRRNRALRRQLRAAGDARAACERRIAELEAELKDLHDAHAQEIAQLKEQVGMAESRAAAEHYRAFKLAHNYKVQELDLNATRTERDLAYERARELTAKIEQLNAELKVLRESLVATDANDSSK